MKDAAMYTKPRINPLYLAVTRNCQAVSLSRSERRVFGIGYSIHAQSP